MAIAASLAWAIGVAAGQQAPVFAALVPLPAIKDDPYSGPDNPVAVLCQAELRRLVSDLAGLTRPVPVPAV
jgi:hypothetical protein